MCCWLEVYPEADIISSILIIRIAAPNAFAVPGDIHQSAHMACTQNQLV